jgi:hypothetical protein
MNIREQLPLNQQFELQVFENQVRQLSHADAQALLIEIRELMMYQNATFRELLKDAWGIGKDVDVPFLLLSEG